MNNDIVLLFSVAYMFSIKFLRIVAKAVDLLVVYGFATLQGVVKCREYIDDKTNIISDNIGTRRSSVPFTT